MITVHTLVLGPLQTNCYVAHAETSNTCVVIDPAFSADEILAFTDEKGLKIEALLLTHGHFDHVGAAMDLLFKTGCKLWMHADDFHMPATPMNDYLYPLHDKKLPNTFFFLPEEEIEAAGLTLSVLETPGHTAGSVCYRCGNVLFSGDTLFAGGCGRTDLPGGDWNTIRKSLHTLAQIPENLRVYPGHGESTTLAQEKQYNPYMR